ncbi:hypothetical protein H4S02_000523 [Coemansia sp. RSA 2611]|nr:hypothetical protein IWW52_000692 [Coemansia sp. RSA 2704]KAJ2369628.1 hypothetical protein H4S01_000890 [Coemansia sp. RSA 2610]KAJ2392902.1 hypothetical protein H4S02_000523 [Coemansia sp. RSA 2611]KAJ2739518.1 hypothetical protein H4R23_000399 [Coemansia sp. Cherry 401B]
MTEHCPTFPGGFPPAPPGYESRWQCWADSWRSRHEEARASDQVAFALEDAATAIGRLSAFEAPANPGAPNAPFALAVEKALISVDSTEHIVTIMTRAYENRVNAYASFNEEIASVRLLQAVEKRENAQLALERALQKYADEKDKHAAVCAALHQAVDAAIARVESQLAHS